MAPPRSEEPLREALEQLRAMRVEDRAAILDLLDPGPRLRAERLLRGDRDVGVAGVKAPNPDYSRAGYSPWLQTRLEGARDAARLMTPAAADLLRASADRGLLSVEPAASPQPGSLRRHLAALFRIRTETA